MLPKLTRGLLALTLLFGLLIPANAQGFRGMYGTGSGQPYVHPADTFPYCSPYCYSPDYTYLAYYTPYYPGYPYGWWWSISWWR